MPHPTRPEVLYIGSQGVQRSEDFGETWLDRSRFLPQENFGGSAFRALVDGLVIDVDEPSRLLAASKDSLFRTENEGETWEYFGQIGGGLEIHSLCALGPSTKDPFFQVLAEH